MSESPLAVRKEAWSGSDNRLARAVARPMVRFLAQEAASGLLLLAAAITALVWANSPWGHTYFDFWHTEVVIDIGGWEPFTHDGHPLTLEEWVNDGLMVLFFFVVGLEIKSELVVGDLSNRRIAALPAIAAIGGMVVPALFYFMLNTSTPEADGWGIPMATDIAFAVGVLALLGKRVPQRLKLFLLTLAIVDDIGAITVIAVFYSSGVSLVWLALAILGLLMVMAMKRAHIWYIPVYVIVGIGVWYATFRSGVHPTIAGVALGLIAPARPLLGPRRFESVEDIFSGDVADPVAVRNANWKMKESVSICSRLLVLISPWTSFFVIPIFALANAGVSLSADSLNEALTSTVAWGIILGLVIGKPLGIVLAALVATRSGLATLPPGINFRQVAGAGAVAGIGFTVALFINRLAFDDPEIIDNGIIGILVASLLATLLGWLILRGGQPTPSSTEVEERQAEPVH